MIAELIIANVLRCVIASALTALILVGLMWVGGLRFWLIYWLIVAISMPLMWWGIDVWLTRRKSKRVR